MVACAPTGHRWRVLDQIAAGADVRLVCCATAAGAAGRESEDFTRTNSDDSAAVIIARLVPELRC